ncbi:hypothetical protein [Amycolatopsis sp. DSM 110486]|uniref:hypothetical protein n=1 Tax=Amycolatopsis sp. DSM 110486 TaxID=2865832 RepID=UPI001C69445A|nr:hypothetical protein [Amycolatopsis sp. DSM 110486]QYN23162.1 hypothetical protein K1T34_12290 [Amycolatopsis sp. DSM 110486]
MTTLTVDNGDELTEMFNQHGFGPVTRTWLARLGQDNIPVYNIAPDSPTKARTLLRWLDIVDVIDAIAGKRNATDPLVQLNIRGRLPHGDRVIVTATFDERTETAQTDHIHAVIECQQIRQLVANLADMEQD